MLFNSTIDKLFHGVEAFSYQRSKVNADFSIFSTNASSSLSSWHKSNGEAEVLLDEPMAGVHGCNVAAVHGQRWVPLWRHLAGGQGRAEVQPAAGGGARRCQEPRGLRGLPRRGALGHAAGVGAAAHGRGPQLLRLRVVVARRHQAGAGAAPLDSEPASVLHLLTMWTVELFLISKKNYSCSRKAVLVQLFLFLKAEYAVSLNYSTFLTS